MAAPFERIRPRRHFWGDDPAEEDGYYAAQGIHATSSFYTSPRGITLFTRSWQPRSSATATSPLAVVCLIHGYGNDISWTFQSTPIFLAQHGYACFALDLPGHGRSEGLRAFVPDVDAVARDCLAYFRSVRRSPGLQGLPCFLFGESMGGALCLLIHLLEREEESQEQPAWDGAVLVAPMCKISDSMRPRWPIPEILTFVARFAPTLPIVPTADLVEKSVKVEEKRIVAASNPQRYGGRPRLGTVVELIRVTDHLNSRLSEVTIPFIVLHGSADVVTDPGVSQALYDTAGSKDKTIKIYDGMLHSMLFGETEENIAKVRNDILLWLNERSQRGGSCSRH
ncbi:caffeoylshikimate esterase [Canna indica]|uniref:Caffeoylshikimate esterase n=1 Tax=Canna indica TaxID=4628 RepID=A0AAQ3PZT3_9LILI|nr:caffeoylshikimate esterase [Canna indica]